VEEDFGQDLADFSGFTGSGNKYTKGTKDKRLKPI
jgi:hypothetical protein